MANSTQQRILAACNVDYNILSTEYVVCADLDVCCIRIQVADHIYRGSSVVHWDDPDGKPVEQAQDIALGRALAFANIAIGSGIASKEEIQQAQRLGVKL